MNDEILEESVQDEGMAPEGAADAEGESTADGQNEGGFSDEDGEEKASALKTDAPKAEKNTDGKSAKNAERRRAMEAAEAKAVREEAILDALGHKNPFTDEEMKDSEDVEEYLMMREIEESGGDPLRDFSKYQKQKAREKREALEKESAGRERLAADVARFGEEFPDVDISTLFDDPNFAAYADGKLGAGGATLTDVYRDYVAFVERLTGEKAARAKEAQAIANQRASVGSLSSSHKETQGYYTPEQVRAMTKEEVHANYENIMKSMKKWK